MTEKKECLNKKCREDLLALVIDAIPHPVFVKDENGRFLLANQAAGGLAGIPGKKMSGRRADHWLADMEARERIKEQDKRVIQEGIGFYGLELEVPDNEGVLCVHEISKVPIQLSEGKRGVLGVAVEVTRRRRMEREMERLLKEKELVLKEVHHRIKNNMNNMAMLLTIQADSLTEPAAVQALHDARSRIQTMMVIYDKLYRSADFLNLSLKDYLAALLDEVKKTFPNHERIRVHNNIEGVSMDSRKLMQVGMIINELFTNAMKHAYEEDQPGSIVVEAMEEAEMIHLAVQDFGKGLPEEKEEESNREGFGLEMVHMLAIQMGGALAIEKGNGVRFVVKIKK